MIDNLYYRNKYRIPSTRLGCWDYGWNAAYFITICTYNRAHYFGEIVDDVLDATELADIVFAYWYQIPDHFPFIQLDAFIIMPNHIHAILIIDKENSPQFDTQFAGKQSPGEKRYRNQGKATLSSVIGAFKSICTRTINQLHPTYDFRWQPRFHDHIIRNTESFNEISEYINMNPSNWKDDKFY